MIKAELTWRRGHLRFKMKGSNTCEVEAVALIAEICKGFEGKCPGTTAEELLNAAKVALQAVREEDKKTGGLKVACYKDADGCKDLGRTGHCARFGCMCEAVHCEEEREDE